MKLRLGHGLKSHSFLSFLPLFGQFHSAFQWFLLKNNKSLKLPEVERALEVSKFKSQESTEGIETQRARGPLRLEGWLLYIVCGH